MGKPEFHLLGQDGEGVTYRVKAGGVPIIGWRRGNFLSVRLYLTRAIKRMQRRL